jgi:NodT family efflux transporter outer membrane factor (OMF) lipoprotein
MRLAGIAPLLIAATLLASCAAKRDAYDVPKIRLPEKFAQAPAVVDATVSPPAQALAAAATPGSGMTAAGKTVAGTPEPDSATADAASKPPAESGEAALPASPLAAALPEWWRMLGSEELNRLIDRALANNHDLRIASLRIAQLKARMEIAGADKWPTVTLPVQSETYYPEWGIGNPNNNNKSRSIHQISLRADWRPDLWGETASQYESAEFQLMRATYQRDDMQRIVVARIAADYLEYLSLNDRLRATRQTERTLKEMFESVKARMEIGDATVTDLEQQRAAGYAVRATIPVLEQQRVVVHNRIAGFVGTVPEELILSGQGMDTVAFPAVLPGVPATLLLRRPDVRAIEARLLAADADIDVARARLLPPLDLTAQAGFGSLFLSQLFSSPTLFWNTIANLSITLFDSGKRDKEVEFARAIHEEMVETYIRVIYDAVREVDDSLGTIRHMGKQIEEQSVAVESSFRAWQYSQEAYHAGASDYLVVRDTERTYHRHLDDLYRYRMERYRGLVNLFSALGGGAHMGDKLPGEGHRPAAMPDEVDYGVVLDAVVAGLHPTINPAPLGYDHAPAALGHNGDEPAERNPSAALLPSPDDNHEIGHVFRDPLIVALTSTAPSIGQTVGIDWDGDTLRPGAWLVELFGTFDRNAIAPAWRDLRARFPHLVKGRKLLPRRQDGALVREMERQSWYRLFVSAFPDRQAAADICAALRAATLHCGVVSSSSLADRDPYNAGRTLNDASVITGLVSQLALQSADEGAAGGKPPVPETTEAAEVEEAPLTVGGFDTGGPEFWLVELPPVRDQRAIATAWRTLREHFPGQMKIRTLLTREEPDEDGKEAQHRLFIARFPTRAIAVEFCGKLHATLQTCTVLSSRAVAQRGELDASWSTGRSFSLSKEREETR